MPLVDGFLFILLCRTLSYLIILSPFQPPHSLSYLSIISILSTTHRRHNNELLELHDGPNIIKTVKSRRLIRIGHVVRLLEERPHLWP